MAPKREPTPTAPHDMIGIKIGGGADQTTIAAIMRILDAPHVDQKVKLRALDVLNTASSVEGVTISGNTISMPR